MRHDAIEKSDYALHVLYLHRIVIPVTSISIRMVYFKCHRCETVTVIQLQRMDMIKINVQVGRLAITLHWKLAT